MWRQRFILLALLAIAIATAGCGGDKSTAPKPDEITGVWTATKIEYVAKPPNTGSVDLVAEGGSGQLTLGADKSFEMILCESEAEPDTTRGAWTIEDEELVFTPQGAGWDAHFAIQLSGDTLRLLGGDMLHDCDGDGTPEESDLNLWLIR